MSKFLKRLFGKKKPAAPFKPALNHNANVAGVDFMGYSSLAYMPEKPAKQKDVPKTPILIIALLCAALTASGQWCELPICKKSQESIFDDTASLIKYLDYGELKCISTTVPRAVLWPTPAIINGTAIFYNWIRLDRIVNVNKNSKIIIAPYAIAELQLKMYDSTRIIVHAGAQARFDYLRMMATCIIVMAPGSSLTCYDNNGINQTYKPSDYWVVSSWGEQIPIINCFPTKKQLDFLPNYNPSPDLPKEEPGFTTREIYYARMAKPGADWAPVPTDIVSIYSITGDFIGTWRQFELKLTPGVYFARSNGAWHKLIVNP